MTPSPPQGLPAPAEATAPLLELLRTGAQPWLAGAVEAELAVMLEVPTR